MLLLKLSLIEILQLVILLIISISLHEFAHAWVSYKLGDPTPKLQGRVSLNPLVHIDPMGLFLLFIIGFGWGKPVEVNPMYYKNKKIGELKVALAGPIMNLCLTTIGVILYISIGAMYTDNINTLLTLYNTHPLFGLLLQFSLLNIILAIFNLMPIPPLDGFTIIETLHSSLAEKILRYQQIIFPIFILLIIATPFGNIFMTIGEKILSLLFIIFGSIFF